MKNIVPTSYGFHEHVLAWDTSKVKDTICAATHEAAFVCSDWKDFLRDGVSTLTS